MIKEIEALNAKIDKLMTEKTKADAQKEVWENRLLESIAQYEASYGVKIKGETLNLKDIKSNLKKEIEEVEKETAREYEKSQKIVSLIEQGDIKGAWKMLGYDIDEKEEVEEVVEDEEVVSEDTKLQGVQEAVDDVEGIDDVDDSDFFGRGFSDDSDEEDEFVTENYVESEPVKKPEKKVPTFSFEDDDDDDYAIPTKKSMTMDDDSDEEDDDDFGGFGGFGSILKGSKFEV